MLLSTLSLSDLIKIPKAVTKYYSYFTPRTPNRSEVGIVFCNIAVVLEFGDGWLLDSLVVEGRDISVVTEIRRAESDRIMQLYFMAIPTLLFI